MSEDDSAVDPAQLAFQRFTELIGEFTHFSVSAFGGIKLANDAHNLGRTIGMHEKPRKDTGAQFEYLRGLMLLALWAGFEAFFEDFCKGVLMRTISAQEAQSQYVKIFNKSRSKRKTSLTKFEAILEPLARHGDIPPNLLTAFKEAEAIRNIWAHNAGRVDEKFLHDAPGLELTLGDKVNMDVDQYIKYIQAISMYSIVISTRDTIALGYAALPEDYMGDGQFRADYATLFCS
ncbi:hypothetical protein [Mycolicibacterium helvum]|uniref:RiboL-PSP-HEPN domain-containing protein n=1 Tax=Mycolicibacterium helvum TaxID=1534349 RepID=A0A7I7TF55_9MYCO|nr:hypothetical protein [Mycolicibacterium helvum]BBY67748.1 hypothetical protein MHEL_59910 [Mycolicibacterium helvum]